MRFTPVALPILAGLATVNASLDFNVIFKADPALKHIKPTTTKSIDRVATAQSIIAVLRSSHEASMQAASAAGASQTKSMVTSVRTTSKAALTTAKSSQKAPSKAAPKSTATSTARVSSTAPAKVSSAAPEKSTKAKRAAVAACSNQSYLYGYAPSPNTGVQFSVDSTLTGLSAAALPPAGYTRQFVGLSASIFADSQYLGSSELSSYNTTLCAAACNAWSGCTAFNIYFERDPAQFPGTNCPNPAASTLVRCALWKSQVTATQAVNYGEFRTQFIVLVAGSNLYWRNTAPAAIAGFSGPTALTGFVDTTVQTGAQFYAGAYNVTQCSALCSATNAQNSAATAKNGQSTYTACNYFNAAMISSQGTAYGTYCGLYANSSVAVLADIYSQTISGVQYDVTYSYGYTATTTFGNV